MCETLASSLRVIRLDAMRSQAQAIRDYPDSDERTEEARKLIHAVLYDFALGRISDEEREQILDVLHFARKPCTICPDEPISTFLDEDDRAPGDERPKVQQTFFFMP